MSKYNQSDLITQARVERMTELSEERFAEIERARGIIDGCKVRIAELEAVNRKRDLMLINHVRGQYRANFREASDAHSSNILDAFNGTPAATTHPTKDTTITAGGRKIVTSFDNPPIPSRVLDWSAVLDGYEPGDPAGHGQTELAAIRDLLERIEEACA